MLATFQKARRFTPRTAALYERLAADRPLVAALGVEMPSEPAPGVRGQAIDADEALRGQWNVVILGAHIAGALVAADLGDEGPDLERRFDFVISYERELVVGAASSLIARIGAAVGWISSVSGGAPNERATCAAGGSPYRVVR